MWEKGLEGRAAGVGVHGVLGKRCLCDCWGEGGGKEEWEMVGVARLWMVLTLLLRGLDYVLQLMGTHGTVSEQGDNLIF